MCGNKNTTTTATTAPNPQAMAAYSNLLNQAGSVAQTPFTPYGGEFVAPVNQQQQTGIAGINANANSAQPLINQAQGFATQAAQPITASQIQQYQNPFTQQVVNSTQAEFNQQNAQQQSALAGNAAAQGALGGDRVGVAQANLAQQQQLAQAPVIAGLYNQGYNTATQTALAEQQNTGNAAYSLGNLGVAGQNAALTGAGAQVGAGTLQQQTQQGLDTALYQQFLQQQAYPFQTTQWQAGIDTGVGSQMGGTSTTTPPPPNPWNTALGLGTAAFAAYARDGGRVRGFALGGTPYSDVTGYVPTMQITGGQGAPKPPSTPAQQGSNAQQSGFGNLKGETAAFKGASNLWNKWGSNSTDPLDLTGGFSSGSGLGTVQDIGSAPEVGFGLGPLYAKGGKVPMGQPIQLKRGFDDGGPVTMAGLGTGSILPFADRWSPVDAAIAGGDFDPQGSNATAFAAPASDSGPIPVKTASVKRPGLDLGNDDDAGGLPSLIARGSTDSQAPVAGLGDDGGGALAYDSGTPTAGAGSASAAPADGEAAPSRGGLLSGLGLNLSSNARQALLAAGLGMMASRSPYLGQAIGEGGLQGLSTYSNAQKETNTEKKTQADIEHGKNQLAQAAKLAQDRLAAEQKHWTDQATHQDAVLAESKRQHDMSLKAPVNLGADPRTGMPIMALPRLNKDGGLDYHLIGPNGQISDTPMGGTPAPAATPGPTSEVPSSPGNAAQPVRTAALETGTASDVPRPGEGTIQHNQRVAQAGAFDYGTDAPYIEKGLDVPEPAPLAGRSVQALKTDSEYYLQTGKLPPVVRGNSPVAMVQQRYQNAVKNYGNALAQSRGMSSQEVAEAWRTAPGMLRFVLGADGRSTVSLGTAVRHLDTMQQLTDAWEKGSTVGDWRTWNQVTSGVRREFGDAAVTNLQSAAKIIGPEVIKAIGVAGAGGEREREAMESIFSPTSTPGQIKGAIGTVQTLLGGQLEGRQRQAENAGVSRERFKSLIGDRPYELLTHTGGAAGPAQAAPAVTPGNRVGDERQFKQGVGVWNGTAWVPKGSQ